jgi:hypothetical protein
VAGITLGFDSAEDTGTESVCNRVPRKLFLRAKDYIRKPYNLPELHHVGAVTAATKRDQAALKRFFNYLHARAKAVHVKVRVTGASPVTVVIFPPDSELKEGDEVSARFGIIEDPPLPKAVDTASSSSSFSSPTTTTTTSTQPPASPASTSSASASASASSTSPTQKPKHEEPRKVDQKQQEPAPTPKDGAMHTHTEEEERVRESSAKVRKSEENGDVKHAERQHGEPAPHPGPQQQHPHAPKTDAFGRTIVPSSSSSSPFSSSSTSSSSSSSSSSSVTPSSSSSSSAPVEPILIDGLRRDASYSTLHSLASRYD